MQTLTQVVKACSDFLWGVPMLVMLFGTHLFLTVRLRFVQRHTLKAIRLSVTPDKGSEGEVSQFGALATALAACPHVRTMGVFSHFSTGETKESPTAYRQFQLYQQALAQLQAAGIDPPQKHMCNSGGSDWFRASFCNAVRIGRRLYMDNQAEPLTPGTPGAVQEACSWRASVTNLRVVEAGDTVGYDAAWTAPRRTRVATVCVGYGDGLYYPLAEAGGPLLVGEQRARLLATCMDQCFVDVTDIPCRAGDEVTFFGQSSGGAAMPIQELGKFMHVEGVYFYSFLSPRVARVYEGLEP